MQEKEEGQPVTVDLAIVGHIVLDYITREGRTHGPKVGGPCTYAGMAARALGASVALVSRVGGDFGYRRLIWFRTHGISVRHVRVTDSATTCFRIDYRNGGRRMQVTSRCELIGRQDITTIPLSKAIHIGPVIQEISQSVTRMLLERDSVIGLDPQGYLRRLAHDGTVLAKKWLGLSVLRKVDVLKVAEDELQAIAGGTTGRIALRRLGRLGPEIILLTRGPKGTTLWSREEGAFHIPAYDAIVQDPTGAGDALIGAFLVTWIRSGDLLWSASMGSAVASFVVEMFGPASFGTQQHIESRARRIFDGTARL